MNVLYYTREDINENECRFIIKNQCNDNIIFTSSILKILDGTLYYTDEYSDMVEICDRMCELSQQKEVGVVYKIYNPKLDRYSMGTISPTFHKTGKIWKCYQDLIKHLRLIESDQIIMDFYKNNCVVHEYSVNLKRVMSVESYIENGDD